MMTETISKLSAAALLPVFFTVFFLLLERKTAFQRWKYAWKQLVIGLIFGGIAILGTEFGIPAEGAQLNCRDAAVMTAGLLFGSPAGILAGLIGGIERWFAVYHGIGVFTRNACTISTIFAGFFAAALRKLIFREKAPSPVIALTSGAVIEVFHMMMVFMTNLETPVEAMQAVKAASVPMICANAVSVSLSAFVLTCASPRRRNEQQKPNISQSVRGGVLIAVLFTFLLSSFFIYRQQTALSQTQISTQISQSLDNITNQLLDLSDRKLLSIAHKAADHINSSNKINRASTLETLRFLYEISEVSLIDQNGIIIDSTEPSFIGFDMASGEQASEFLCLLNGETEFVQEFGPITKDGSRGMKYAGVSTDNGFVQIGNDGEKIRKELESDVINLTQHYRMGNSGYVLILGKDQQILSAPSWMDEVTPPDLSGFPQETNISLEIDGEPCFCRYRTVEEYQIAAILPESEAQRSRDISVYVNTFLEILTFALLFGVIYILLNRIVVIPIEKIAGALGEIADGNLEEKVNVRENAEFDQLSDNINTTVDALKEMISEAESQFDQELALAREIQASSLIRNFPAFPKRHEFDIYALMDPAKEVGGDFYDLYMTGPQTLHFSVADVSGKGIPAAMFMMRAKAELKSLTESGLPLNEVFTRGNNALCGGNDAGMFVTAWQGSLDLETGMLQYCCAGHNPPLLCHADGSFEYLRSKPGFILGGMEGIRYTLQEMQLISGDILFLYTDGVTEASDPLKELYGENRLQTVLNTAGKDDMQELCAAVRSDIDRFANGAPQFDDITMLAMRFIGTPPAPSIHFAQAKTEDVTAVCEFAESELEKAGCPMKIIFQLNIAIDEIFSNIIKYAYPKKTGPVTVSVQTKDEPHCVTLCFEDEGIPFNPLPAKDPDTTLSAEEREIGGLGIFIVKQTMDDIRYRYEEGKNILTIIRNLD